MITYEQRCILKQYMIPSYTKDSTIFGYPIDERNAQFIIDELYSAYLMWFNINWIRLKDKIETGKGE